MSHGKHHGGGRRRYKDHEVHDDRRQDIYFETPEQKVRTTLIKFGEVEAAEELPLIVGQLREQSDPLVPAIAEGFRVGITEQPYKIPYYAALLRSLHAPTAEDTDTGSFGKQILDDFWKGFQTFLDRLAWREVRLCVQFFGHLTAANVISPSSMLSLLQSFTAVLDEFGVSHSRAKNAAFCAAEGLIKAGSTLKTFADNDVTAIIASIQNYNELASSNKSIVTPLMLLHSNSSNVEEADEVLDSLLAVLRALDASEFADTLSSFLQPYSGLPEVDLSATSYFDLPPVLVPPEIIELEGMVGESNDSNAYSHRKEEWPEFHIRIFDDEVSADPKTAPGYTVRTLIFDIIDIFEVNRKECARILLELPKWLPAGTFKPRPGVPALSSETEGTGKQWQLESCIIEAVLSKFFVIPESTYKPVYYVALITELCKLSPSTVGPAVGKSIRKLYGLLSDGLDIEIVRKFIDWFTVHMSNFGFQWVWKEWIPDLSLTNHHPKRSFMKRAIEIEIRLSYYERALKTLPEPFHESTANILPDQAPGSDYDYDDPSKPHHDSAQSILNLIRGRAKADDVKSHIESLRNSIAETTESDINVDSALRSITMQSLLHIGSRSFSHFLNAVERYLPLLRYLASSSDAKADILAAVADFWRRNRQMIIIVFDKLMQYQIVDPYDVVAWAFSVHKDRPQPTLDWFHWDVVKAAIDKSNGRVIISKRKISSLRKAEDDDRARAKASGGDVAVMEVDADGTAAADEPVTVETPAMTNALKVHDHLLREQKAVLSRTLDDFVAALSQSSSVITEKGWDNRANWNDLEWDVWETWGWYRHYCRAYAPYLRDFATNLSTIAFVKIEDSSSESATLIKKIWNVSLGLES